MACQLRVLQGYIIEGEKIVIEVRGGLAGCMKGELGCSCSSMETGAEQE